MNGTTIAPFGGLNSSSGGAFFIEENNGELDGGVNCPIPFDGNMILGVQIYPTTLLTICQGKNERFNSLEK